VCGRTKERDVRFKGWLVIALGVLAGCTTSPSSGSSLSYVSVVGAPLFVALKIPACVGTLVIAAPLGALKGLAPPDPDDVDADAGSLNSGIADNCGPPYILPPE
jgi:hypothetical protein